MSHSKLLLIGSKLRAIPGTMKAIRIQSLPPKTPQYSTANPAPSSALRVYHDVPKPLVSRPEELVVQVKATSVIRDSLTWPELYMDPPSQPGNDFAGIVVAVHEEERIFKPGDEVYGMTSASRGATWADFALVNSEEAYPKPGKLSWEEAAALPLSALTADQALFIHARLKATSGEGKRVLITGAAGGVGMLLVQFAAAAGHHVVAATSSNARNSAFLQPLGTKEMIEYGEFSLVEKFDAVIDTVGGDVLRNCWPIIRSNGVLVSVDSNSWDFAKKQDDPRFSEGSASVRAIYFVVTPSRESMARISNAVKAGVVKTWVSRTMPLEGAVTAYELCQSGNAGRGKVVLLP